MSDEYEEINEEEKSKGKNITVDINYNQDLIKHAASFILFKRRLVKEARKLGLPASEEELQTYDDVMELLEDIQTAKGLSRLEQEEFSSIRSAPSGSAPLTPAQKGEEDTDTEFESLEDMISFLQRKEKAGTSEEHKGAKAILDKLFEKWWRGQKNPKYRGFEIEGKQTFKDIEKEMRKRRLLKEKALKEEIENV